MTRTAASAGRSVIPWGDGVGGLRGGTANRSPVCAACEDAAVRADDIIAALSMEPHPEGGHYVETWRGPDRGDGRPVATAIYFLLRAGERSHWHRVDADEVWLFHRGSPLRLSIAADDESTPVEHVLGVELGVGHRPQVVVPAGAWQAAEPMGDHTLVSCTVSPGFEFAGFELAAPDWRPGGAV